MKITKTRRVRIGTLGAIVSMCIAVAYLFLPPTEANTTQGLARFVLLCGHSLCWLAFSTASLLWALHKSPRLIRPLMYTGLVLYVAFILVLLRST